MKRTIIAMHLAMVILAFAAAARGAQFDERLWERYAELNPPGVNTRDALAALYLEPRQLGDISATRPFADLRVVTDRRQELPWQVVAKRPERRQEEIAAQMRNLSVTDKNESWVELVPAVQGAAADAVEIETPDSDFSRQVQVLGSRDGRSWNTLRRDGVIFDASRGERMRRTRVTFPQASFPLFAVKIANGEAGPLRLSGVRLIRQSDAPGETYVIPGTTVSAEFDASRKENSIVVRMETAFPLDRLRIATPERNFQRLVEVQIKRGGNWVTWARGTIYNFDTPTMHEAETTIDIPEATAKEYRLVFRNLDSPPLAVTGVSGEGFRRVLVFKQQPERKLYLFWGNPAAAAPSYDLGGLLAGHRVDNLPMAYLGEPRQNSRFAGNSARLPFSERYKYLLYAVVIIAIAALVLLQYRVIRRVE